MVQPTIFLYSEQNKKYLTHPISFVDHVDSLLAQVNSCSIPFAEFLNGKMDGNLYNL